MAAHRYWRLYITAPGTWNSIGELELRDSAGGADRTGSGTASASHYYDGSYLPAYACDNNTSTAWANAGGAPPEWWQYDFGAGNAYDIVEISLRPRATKQLECPRAFAIQYSDNGTDWTTSWSYPLVDEWKDGQTRIFTNPAAVTPTTVNDPTTDIAGCIRCCLAEDIAASNNDPLSQWPDTSGDANHLTQATEANKPLYLASGDNGWPAVVFDGDSAFFDLSGPSLTAGSIFAVLKSDADPSASITTSCPWHFGTPLSGNASHHPYTDGVLYEAAGSSVHKNAGNPVDSLAALHAYLVRSAADDFTIDLNGQRIYSSGTNTVEFATTGGRVGRSSATMSHYYGGRFYALIEYDHELSLADALGLQAWAQRYFAEMPTPPATPTGLAADAISPTEIDVAWDPMSGATSYTLQRAPDSGGSPGVWATIYTGADPAYDDVGRDEQTKYWYHVLASNGAGDSAYCTAVSETTPASNVPPDAPTILSVTDITASSCTVTASAFSDLNLGDVHAATRWTVDFWGEDFLTPVLTVTHAPGETSTGLTGLPDNADLGVIAEYQDQDGAWSNPSAPFRFQTLPSSTPAGLTQLPVSTVMQQKAPTADLGQLAVSEASQIKAPVARLTQILASIVFKPVPPPCSLLLECFKPDGETLDWSVSTDPEDSAPFLRDPIQDGGGSYGAQECDFAKGSATIGSVRVAVIDVMASAIDPQDRWLTKRLADPVTGKTAIMGRRFRYRRWINKSLGWVTIADGPAGPPRLRPSYAGHDWEIRDSRERERKLVAFDKVVGRTVMPRGSLTDWGLAANGTDYLLPAAVPLFGRVSTPAGAGDVVASISFSATEWTSGGTVAPEYMEVSESFLEAAAAAPPEQGKTVIQYIDGFPAEMPVIDLFWKFPGIEVWWRPQGTSTWTVVNPNERIGDIPPLGQGDWTEPSLVTIEDATIGTTGRTAPAVKHVILTDYSGKGVLPTVQDQDVDVLFVYRGAPTAKNPLYIESTAGQLIRDCYDGKYSPKLDLDGDGIPETYPDTGILYDPTYLTGGNAPAEMDTPVLLRITEQVDDLRDWLERNVYAAIGCAPSLDRFLQIAPLSQLPPADLSGAVNITNAVTSPAPGWEHGSKIVNDFTFTYRRLYADNSAADGLGSRDVIYEPKDEDSIEANGPQPLEITTDAFCAVGGAAGAILGKETGAALAELRKQGVFLHLAAGAPMVHARVMRSATPLLRPGDWVLVNLSWMPDYTTGKRGLIAYGQVVSAADADCAWRDFIIDVTGAVSSVVQTGVDMAVTVGAHVDGCPGGSLTFDVNWTYTPEPPVPGDIFQFTFVKQAGGVEVPTWQAPGTADRHIHYTITGIYPAPVGVTPDEMRTYTFRLVTRNVYDHTIAEKSASITLGVMVCGADDGPEPPVAPAVALTVGLDSSPPMCPGSASWALAPVITGNPLTGLSLRISRKREDLAGAQYEERYRKLITSGIPATILDETEGWIVVDPGLPGRQLIDWSWLAEIVRDADGVVVASDEAQQIGVAMLECLPQPHPTLTAVNLDTWSTMLTCPSLFFGWAGWSVDEAVAGHYIQLEFKVGAGAWQLGGTGIALGASPASFRIGSYASWEAHGDLTTITLRVSVIDAATLVAVSQLETSVDRWLVACP